MDLRERFKNAAAGVMFYGFITAMAGGSAYVLATNDFSAKHHETTPSDLTSLLPIAIPNGGSGFLVFPLP